MKQSARIRHFVALGGVLASLAGVTNAFGSMGYSVTGPYSTTPQSVYHWDETPWVYVQIPLPNNGGYPVLVSTSFDSVWSAPSGKQYEIKTGGYPGYLWLAGGTYQPGYWEVVREAGTWNVATTWHHNFFFAPDGPEQYATATFTVVSVPELTAVAMSAVSLLFVAGGCVWRRRAK